MEKFEQNDLTGKQMSRKKFLRTCGSIVAGGAILGVSGVSIKNSWKANPNAGANAGNILFSRDDAFASPYRLVSSFSLPDKIEGMDLYNDEVFVAGSGHVSVFDVYGKKLHLFDIEKGVRDIVADYGAIYLLYPAKIAVYSRNGEMIREWEACSELSDYCSFALASGFVFATDVSNKNICQYTTEGNFVRFINSPNRFIIPSYTFGIEHVDGVLFCSNPGRHQVEKYSLNGEYLGAFGKPGAAPGFFTGCCNPVYLSYTLNGDIITSEKGDPRISCYSPDGKFKSILLDSKNLGGGNTAYDMKVRNDKIFVAGEKQVSIFHYDNTQASNSACSSCKTGCPLREGVTI